MNEDDDTPILEIPVHISKRMSDKLYVFQYLNLLPHNSLKNEHIKNCAVKPKLQEVQIEIGLRTTSTNFDTSKAENFAVNIDGVTGLIANKDEKTFFDSNIMDKQIYKTIKAINDVSNYAVGVISQNEIHLIPTHGILHLRPDLEHIDGADKRSKLREPKATESGDEDEPSTSAETEPQKITVRFARAESEKEKKLREQSFDHFSKQSSEEPWIETKWCHIDSLEAEIERNNLYPSQTQDVQHTLALPMDTYSRQLIPLANVNYEAPVVQTDSTISLAALKSLPLTEQCKNLIKDAVILTFEQITNLLSIDISKRDELLKTLPSCAVLVRGLWITKSELLYPTNSFSAKNGVPSEFMCRSRDYVLYLFTTSDFVSRRKVATTVKIPTDELIEIFQNIAHYEKNKGWQLLLPPDDQFIARYPDIVQRQQLFWETKSKNFLNYIKESSKSGRNRKKSNRDSVSSDAECSGGGGGSKINGVYNHRRDNSCSSDTDSGTEKVRKSTNVSRKRTKINLDSTHLRHIEKPIGTE